MEARQLNAHVAMTSVILVIIIRQVEHIKKYWKTPKQYTIPRLRIIVLMDLLAQWLQWWESLEAQTRKELSKEIATDQLFMALGLQALMTKILPILLRSIIKNMTFLIPSLRKLFKNISILLKKKLTFYALPILLMKDKQLILTQLVKSVSKTELILSLIAAMAHFFPSTKRNFLLVGLVSQELILWFRVYTRQQEPTLKLHCAI